MHPVMTEKLAAARIREMVAQGDDARRAREARRARLASAARRTGQALTSRPGRPRRQPEPGRVQASPARQPSLADSSPAGRSS